MICKWQSECDLLKPQKISLWKYDALLKFLRRCSICISVLLHPGCQRGCNGTLIQIFQSTCSYTHNILLIRFSFSCFPFFSLLMRGEKNQLIYSIVFFYFFIFVLPMTVAEVFLLCILIISVFIAWNTF